MEKLTVFVLIGLPAHGAILARRLVGQELVIVALDALPTTAQLLLDHLLNFKF